MMNDVCQQRFRWMAALGAAVLVGCAAPEPDHASSPAAAWRQREPVRAEASPGQQRQPAHRAGPPGVPEPTDGAEPDDEVIASVNGRPIMRRAFVNALVKSYGAGVLDQRIGLEAARMHAAKVGVSVTEADVEREYGLALRRLSDPLAEVSPGPFDRTTAERLLDSVLAERNMSRDEFDIVMRRNAYLRKAVQAQQTFTEEDLRREYARLYDQRVQVRHIQLATIREVEQAKARLDSGEDFADVARKYSANRSSARDGGLLEAFAEADDRLPLPFRQAAFSLQSPGDRSSAVRVGEWYHLLQLETVIPARTAEFEVVQPELKRSLSERAAETALPVLFEKLFREATIRIHDPVLEAAFDRRHPDRSR